MQQNRFLASLPADTFAALRPHLIQVGFERGQPLYEAKDSTAIFPTSGLFATLMDLDGTLATVGLVGADFHVGDAEAVDDNQSRCWKVLVSGQGLMVRAERLRDAVEQHPALKAAVGRQTTQLLVEAQRELAHRSAALADARLALCLLDISKKLRQADIPLNQDDLAEILGMQRTTVCGAAVRLRNKGAVKYRRGKLTIVDEERLTDLARIQRNPNNTVASAVIGRSVRGSGAQAVQFA